MFQIKQRGVKMIIPPSDEERGIKINTLWDAGNRYLVIFFSLFDRILFMVANKNVSGGRTTCRSIKDKTGSMYSGKVHTLSYHGCRDFEQQLNRLNTNVRPLYLKAQSVPRCKHFSSRL
jgi:hypothetical protein